MMYAVYRCMHAYDRSLTVRITVPAARDHLKYETIVSPRWEKGDTRMYNHPNGRLSCPCVLRRFGEKLASLINTNWIFCVPFKIWAYWKCRTECVEVGDVLVGALEISGTEGISHSCGCCLYSFICLRNLQR